MTGKSVFDVDNDKSRLNSEQIVKNKKGLPIGSPFLLDYVTRMGLEPMTPTLKVLCSTS